MVTRASGNACVRRHRFESAQRVAQAVIPVADQGKEAIEQGT